MKDNDGVQHSQAQQNANKLSEVVSKMDVATPRKPALVHAFNVCFTNLLPTF